MNKIVRIHALILALTALAVSPSRAMMYYFDTYVIADVGSGSYYFDALSDGANTNWNGSTFTYNLLGGSTLTLKGGEVKAYRDDGGNYWNGNNTQTVNYAVYTNGATPSFSASQILAGGSGGSVGYLGGNDFGATNSSGNVNLASSINRSGTDWRVAIYFSGNASYDSGGQQYFNMSADSNGGANYVANVTAYYGATTTGTQASAFSGSGYFNFNGSGQTYTLNQANTYTGETQIDAGTVALSGSLNSASTIYIGSGNNSSDAALTLSGTTTLANSIQVNVSGGSGARDIVKSDATSQIVSGNLVNNRNSTINVTNAGGNLNLSGVVSGGSSLTKSGAGTLVLSGSSANTISGSVAVNSGTLVLNKSANTDAVNGSVSVSSGAVLTNGSSNQINDGDGVTVSSGGTWALGGNNETVSSLDMDGTLSLGTGQVIVNSGNSEWAGGISGASGSSVVFKQDTTSLIGNNSGLASGSALYIVGGVVGLNNNNAAGSATLYLGETSDSGAAKLDSSVSGTIIGNDIVVRSGSSGIKTIDNATESGSRQITFNGNVSLADTLYVDASSGETTVFGGVISNSSGIVKRGFGTMTIGGASTFEGIMAIDEGTLRIASGGDLTAASNITIGSSIYNSGSGDAALTLASGASAIDRAINVAFGAGARLLSSEGNNSITATISQSANLTISNTTGTLDLNAVAMNNSGNNDLNVNGAGNVTIGGTISAGSGASEIFKNDGGTLTISGDNSSSLYKLHLNAGTTILGSANSLGTAYSDKVNFDGTSTLRVSANIAPASLGLRVGNGITGTVQVDSGNNFSVATLGSSGGTGTFNKTGTGTLTLTGTSTVANANNVSAGTLFVSSGAELAGTTTVSSGGTLAGSGSVGATTIGSGGTISPGNSPGTLSLTNGLTFSAGGDYNWQIYNATGTAGAPDGWDLLAVSGAAWDISGLTAGSFDINLWSLSGISPDANGNAINFNNATSYTWEILTYTSLIGTFNSNLFNINVAANNNTAGFSNLLNNGTFSLALDEDAKTLNLLFAPGAGPGPSPVPEPGTWAAAAMLAGAAGYARWRRRKDVRPEV